MTTEDVGFPNDFMLCYWFTKILLSGHCLSGTAHCCWHAAHRYYLDKTEWPRVLEDRVATVRKGVSTSCFHPWWYVPCAILQAVKAHWLTFTRTRDCILCVGWIGSWQIDWYLMWISRILFTLNLLHLLFYVFSVRSHCVIFCFVSSAELPSSLFSPGGNC